MHVHQLVDIGEKESWKLSVTEWLFLALPDEVHYRCRDGLLFCSFIEFYRVYVCGSC